MLSKAAEHRSRSTGSGTRVRVAIERLTSDGLIDPERVGIVGFSRTCCPRLNALVSKPTLYPAQQLQTAWVEVICSISTPLEIQPWKWTNTSMTQNRSAQG